MKRTELFVKINLCYSIAVTTVLLIVVVTGFNNRPEILEEISVKKINIVDDSGQEVVVLSNKKGFPPPRLDGKTFKRAVAPGGVVFFGESGNEHGGIAFSTKDSVNVNAMVLDYSTMDAIGMVTVEDLKSDDYTAQLLINDRGPKGVIGGGPTRILLANKNGNAGLSLFDSSGKSRVKLYVNENDEVKFEILDTAGNIVKSIY